MRAGAAGMERMDITKRINNAKEAMRREGKHPCGSRTLARGIAYTKQRGWHYDENIDKVRLVFDLFLNDEHRYDRIAKTTGLARFSIRYILRNPIYCGTMRYDSNHDMSPSGYVPSPTGKRGWRKKVKHPPEEVIEIKMPMEPLITRQQFDDIQRLMEAKRHPVVAARANYSPRFTYRGHLFCGDCHALVYTHMTHGTKDFYYCQSKSPRERAKKRQPALPDLHKPLHV